MSKFRKWECCIWTHLATCIEIELDQFFFLFFLGFWCQFHSLYVYIYMVLELNEYETEFYIWCMCMCVCVYEDIKLTEFKIVVNFNFFFSLYTMKTTFFEANSFSRHPKLLLFLRTFTIFFFCILELFLCFNILSIFFAIVGL